MKKLIFASFALSSIALLSGCVADSNQYGTTYVETDPGYTGYTVGDGPYNISNGFSPAFWNPGYNNPLWYNRVYVGNVYHGGYYGRHSGYARGSYVRHGGFTGYGRGHRR